jgi:peptidoglycan/LPS O-acetylase OafA/YrhL
VTTALSTARPARPATGVVAGSLIAAIVIATALNAVVAAIAHAAGASHDFNPLRFQTFTGLTAIGILVGAVGWGIVRGRSREPARLLRVLVPAVLLALFVPDILVGASGSMPGTGWGAVIALMIMHLVVAAVAIPTYQFVLPVARPDRDLIAMERFM